MTRSSADDVGHYLLSSDAAAADPWHLIALASLRRAHGRPISQGRYEALRQALVRSADDLSPAGLRQTDQLTA